MKTKKIIATLLCAGTLLSACSQHKHVEPVRSSVTDLAAVNESELSSALSPLASSIEDAATPAACERLQALKTEADQASDSLSAKYSYFSEFSTDRKSARAAIEVEQSPFTQLFLGEKFQVDDEETFYKKVKQEREAGNIGWTKMAVVNLAKFFGMMKKVQYSATNDKLEEAFPGIFGEANKAEAALYWKIAQRAADVRAVPAADIGAVLSARVPLFPGSGSWSDYAASSRVSLAAAAKAFKGEDQKERLCALVLMQQNFAQLLRVKGHNAPIALAPARGKKLSRLEKLASANPEFKTREIPGAFFDVLAKKSVVVENESIKAYDPSQKLLSVTESVPNGSVVHNSGKLGDALSLMEALLHSYELTSPAAAWLKNEGDYLLGDITKEGKALLPAEAHALALGLTTIHFKNLAALHIKKVDRDGKDAALGGMVAGILLASESKSANVYRVKLADVMRLARVVFYLDHALKQFGKKPINGWETMNPTYDALTLGALVGTTVYSAEHLREVFVGQSARDKANESCQELSRSGGEGPEECVKTTMKARQEALDQILKGNSLRDNLKTLKLPLAMLLAQLGTGRSGCVSEMEWDALSGNRVAGALCSAETKGELASLFEIMARDTRASILLKKAKELRQ